jgi:hypothetical protein
MAMGMMDTNLGVFGGSSISGFNIKTCEVDVSGDIHEVSGDEEGLVMRADAMVLPLQRLPRIYISHRPIRYLADSTIKPTGVYIRA